MPRATIQKGNVHRSDYLRALVTDTSPGDVPIVFSNDGFYKNMRTLGKRTEVYQSFINAIVAGYRPYTVPYRYNILKGPRGFRRLSLAHPFSQLEVVSFYKEYDHLVCYYCKRSEVSIRSPQKIGSLFFVKGSISEKKRFKGADIDTVSIETAVSNPASYFSYKGFTRAYKFFDSPSFLRLEKRFGVMVLSDISKYFPSMYTHTMFWAISDVLKAKENTRSENFSNKFDKIMQSMNFNETNGICVGAEVSRIFAEIILSRVDRVAIINLKSAGLELHQDYEFFRYVDDYIVFARSEAEGSKILAAISVGLSNFNLHLSEAKTHTYHRPFLTKKSRCVRECNDALDRFADKFLDSEKDDVGRFYFPKKIRRQDALMRFLINELKSICDHNKCGYEMIAGYCISALSSRVISLILDYERAINSRRGHIDLYCPALVLMLEAMFFLYAVYSEVASSLKVARATVYALNFVKVQTPDLFTYISEEALRWIYHFAQSVARSNNSDINECVPLEVLNVMLIASAVDERSDLRKSLIEMLCLDVDRMCYFEIVCFLFLVGKTGADQNLMRSITQRAKTLISGGLGAKVDSQSAHLILDLLACPYIPRDDRIELLQDVQGNLQLRKTSRVDAPQILLEFESSSWFVNWKEIDLLRLIEKKQLSAVYAPGMV